MSSDDEGHAESYVFPTDEHTLIEQVLILSRVEHPVKMDMRERLLAATERVLRSKGLVGATTRAITTAAGCAEGTLYVYFKGRADLFLAVFERRLREAFGGRSALFEDEDAQPQTVLLDAMMQALRFHRDVGPFLAGLFAEPALLKKYRALLLSDRTDAPRAAPEVVAYLRRQQDAKRIDMAVDPATAAEMLLGASFARAFHDNLFAKKPSEADDRAYFRTVIRMLLR